MKFWTLTLVCGTAIMLLLPATRGKSEEEKIIDESRVPPYTLPDPLLDSHGLRISAANAWVKTRRPEILRLFETEVYGRAPAETPKLEFTIDAEDRDALEGNAIRKEVTILVSTLRGQHPLHLLLYVPKTDRPVPVFLGLNFRGNQSVHSDPDITLCESWILNQPESGVVDHRATEASRGCEASRWQVEQVIARGYAVASMCCGDIDPDYDDGYRKAHKASSGFEHGVHTLFVRRDQTAPQDDEWGKIAAWAWGLSRALDYLATDRSIDANRVAVWGHSRLGKAALWAGACDERFAIVISNESGCGGAALSKRIFGETVERINSVFPLWFCRNFRKYTGHEDRLPVDQHMLIALLAPRPVYVASAAEDLHADPRGEFLSAANAEPVYRLFGLTGLGTDEMPPTDRPIGNTIRYHVRSGKHDVTAYDWQQYLDFADRQFNKR